MEEERDLRGRERFYQRRVVKMREVRLSASMLEKNLSYKTACVHPMQPGEARDEGPTNGHPASLTSVTPP